MARPNKKKVPVLKEPRIVESEQNNNDEPAVLPPSEPKPASQLDTQEQAYKRQRKEIWNGRRCNMLPLHAVSYERQRQSLKSSSGS